MSIDRDIKTNFSKYSPLKYKVFHESYIIRKSISWRNIDFERSYVIKFNRRKEKEKFDLFEHSEQIPYFEFFKCNCGSDKITKRKFLLHL